MKGYWNHENYLFKAEFIGNGEISGYALYEVSSFPGVVPVAGEKVKGEVYKVNDVTLQRYKPLCLI
jgi:Uncharacterized conserved protein